MVDVTYKYQDMIESFECDFNLALNGMHDLGDLQSALVNDTNMQHDVDLLRELSLGLRLGIIKIVEVDTK